ncbi:MAG: DNA repair protein RadC [Nanoarchaeota archaeon]
MNILELSPEDRPRERLQAQGSQSLSNAELLALILKSGTQKENVVEICQKLLAKYGLEGLSHATLVELQKEHGIGRAKASQLLALFEIYHRMIPAKKEKFSVTKAEDIAQQYLPRTTSLQKEQFFAVYLNVKNKIIAEEVITMGILNASLIHPREVFHGALKNLAHSVIVLHNHPSGDPTPSEEDLQVTKRLAKTGEVMGIPLIDHIILGNECWWSWKESLRM